MKPKLIGFFFFIKYRNFLRKWYRNFTVIWQQWFLVFFLNKSFLHYFFFLTVINVCVYKCPVNWRPIIKKISENLRFFFFMSINISIFLKDGTHSSLPLVFSPAQVYFVYVFWENNCLRTSNPKFFFYILFINLMQATGPLKILTVHSNTLKLAHTKLCVCICSSQKDSKIWVLNSL